jgi:hypothetical protein
VKQDIQKIALAVGKTGCYYLAVCSWAEQLGGEPVDPLDVFPAFVARGWLGADAYMKNPAEIMGWLAKKSFVCLKAGPGHELALDYVLKYGEYEVLRFERPLKQGESASTESAHFVRGTGVGPMDKRRILWDSWTGSAAVIDGALVSRRIFRRA